jgi:hypothetical protein
MDLNQFDKELYYKKKYLKYKLKYLDLKQQKGGSGSGLLHKKLINSVKNLPQIINEKAQEYENIDKALKDAKQLFIFENIQNYLESYSFSDKDEDMKEIIKRNNYKIIQDIVNKWSSKKTSELTDNDLQNIITYFDFINKKLVPIIDTILNTHVYITSWDKIVKTHDKVVRTMKFDGTGKTNNLNQYQQDKFDLKKKLNYYLIAIIKSYYDYEKKKLKKKLKIKV